jgi:hypothetical protein
MADPSEQFADRPLPAKANTGLFGERPLPASPAPAAPPTVGATRPTRFLVPLVLFVLMIGGTAWLVQNMPNWRAPKPAPQAAPASADLLEFAVTNAVWEDPSLPKAGPKDSAPYAKEVERNDEGRYWYPFKNVTDQPVELSLVHLGCDCSRVDVALVTETEWRQVVSELKEKLNSDLAENPAWSWTPVKDKQVASVPGHAFGLLRMTWVARKELGVALNLRADLWATSPKAAKRQPIGIAAAAVIRRPLEPVPERVHIGLLEQGGTGKADYFLWSPTRDDAAVEVKEPSGDKLFQVEVRKLDKKECAALQAKLRSEGSNTRVRCGFRVSVTVREQEGDHQLDQGPLFRRLEVHMPDAVADLPTLLVVGTV